MGVDMVSVDETAKPEEIKKLQDKVQDLLWVVNVLRTRSKKDAERKLLLQKKNAKQEEKIVMYEGYRKRYLLQEKALANLREEAEELRKKDKEQTELLKEMDEALAYRIAEVDDLTLSAKMMSQHINQLEAGLVASTFVEMEEAEEPRGSHRRTRSLPPRPEDHRNGEEEAAEKLAEVKAIIQYPVGLQPRKDDEDYQQWANAQIVRLNEGAIRVNRLVKDLRGGSAEAVRLRALGIAGD